MRSLVLLVVVIASALAASAQSPAPGAVDAGLRAFWSASSDQLPGATRQLLAAGARFDDLLARVRRGREHGKRATGRVSLPSRDRGTALDNIVEVPTDYDPARAWPLRVTLHGGVGREAPAPGEAPARPLANRIPGTGEIVIHPRAWSGSEWWTAGQVANIGRLLDRVKRDYNVDESRVYVTGISDGGTGVYFLAMRDATAWAACLPLNGHPLVLANPDVGADGQLFPGNLVNCPLRVVNGGRDQLYPAASVAPFIDMFRGGSIPVDFQVYPEAGHDVSWWPEERPRFDAFLAAHRRAAHPERISWETERVDRYNRFRWLVIDRLGVRSSDVPLVDVNRYERSPGRDAALYDRARPSGRVDAVRRGNGFELRTRGVHELTLLLSPDAIDFAQPVRVTVNGRVVHDAILKKDGSTLLKWVARDNDRTMLYAAELKVSVP
jgi:dienelactone hydrolase